MANKTKPQSQRMGYELLINESGQKGADNWRRVGPRGSLPADGLFTSSAAAAEFRQKNYPGVTKYLVRAVRMPSRVLGLEPNQKFQFVTEKSQDQKGKVK